MAETQQSTVDEWTADATLYELVGKIGQGAFSTVWRARSADGRECAVKVLNLDHVDTNLSEIRREVQAMRLSSHPNVLTCYTAFVNNINLWLLTPLMSKGARYTVYKQRGERCASRIRSLEWRIIFCILYMRLYWGSSIFTTMDRSIATLRLVIFY